MTKSQPEKKTIKKQAPVVKLQAFARGGGHTKSFMQFKSRQQTKRLQTARALKSYKKVMKDAGYTPGKGVSRKRPENNTTTHGKKQDDAALSNPTTKDEAMNQKQSPQQSTQQMDPEKQRKQKLRVRRQRHKLLTARTSRGQPIMKHMVADILHKLQSKDPPSSSSFSKK